MLTDCVTCLPGQICVVYVEVALMVEAFDERMNVDHQNELVDNIFIGSQANLGGKFREEQAVILLILCDRLAMLLQKSVSREQGRRLLAFGDDKVEKGEIEKDGERL